MIDQLTIIAPGLLGGSVARAAREKRVAENIVIWARRAEIREAIAGQPWCDVAPETLAEAVRSADLVVIAAPVDMIIPLATQIGPHLKAEAVVTDVGSVKSRICREGPESVGPAAHFLGSHPMAGSERTGWEHGTSDLFAGRTCFVTPRPGALARVTETVSQFWNHLGGKVAIVAPDLHDEIVAHISHLPQALASTLCACLARQDPAWALYAGGGLRDTTRIAASDPEMWRAILQENREPVLAALRRFQNELVGLEQALSKNDGEAVTAVLSRARAYREKF